MIKQEINDNDTRFEFYEHIYEKLFNDGYNKNKTWSQHYGGLVEGVLKPSRIKYSSLKYAVYLTRWHHRFLTDRKQIQL